MSTVIIWSKHCSLSCHTSTGLAIVEVQPTLADIVDRPLPFIVRIERTSHRISSYHTEAFWECRQVTSFWSITVKIVDLGIRRDDLVSLVGWVIVIELRLPVCRQVFSDWKGSACAFL